ncbi:hypothetical protein DERP_000638 [Dermatophagoides pteronyssinus]|uniref:Uncharacterized protein n=1 Tax=Dermatophagoides pteronyssinus TaxID=6956 RepID=A0ABQ8J115_DERPT|nr:hypothetical protein DERP_000638 [Dermatophagoides pteronyssinus]
MVSIIDNNSGIYLQISYNEFTNGSLRPFTNIDGNISAISKRIFLPTACAINDKQVNTAGSGTI